MTRLFKDVVLLSSSIQQYLTPELFSEAKDKVLPSLQGDHKTMLQDARVDDEVSNPSSLAILLVLCVFADRSGINGKPQYQHQFESGLCGWCAIRLSKSVSRNATL